MVRQQARVFYSRQKHESLSKGVHPKVVQEILGHSAINITMDTYSHVLPNIQKDAMGRLDDFFG